MKKEIFTNYFKNGSYDFLRILLASVMMLVTFVQSSYGQCPLACDNLVQVSVDENCKAVITPDMILEDMGQSPCVYTVVVFGTNGLPIPNATVTSAHIGQTLTVAVYLGTNSCWGSIYVEDKFPPVVDCPPNDTVFCNQTKYTLLQPSVVDNCSGVTRHLLSDVITKYPCDSALAGKRTISYYYTDASGNHSDTCNQCVYFRKVDPLVNLVWPRDTIFGKDTILCLNDVPLPNITGVPTVAGEPLYPDWSVCKIGVTYEDQLIPVCPYTFKVLRKWTYIDWCRPSGQNVYTHFQIIKVLDERGPVVACGLNVTISTDIWSCTGTVVLPIPTVIKECSKTTVQVGYKLVKNGDTASLDGTSTNGVTNLGNGFYSVSGLPLGLSWVVFRTTDECGNYTDCATEVLVEDKVPPTPVCDQKTVVTLTIDGTAKVAAETFDDRSHDNCGIDHFDVKRMDDGVPCNTKNGSEFGPYVYFCCADIGKTLMVILRVWDIHGNYNTCMVEIVVQDKLPPVIFCPPHITVSCEFDYTTLDAFGTVRDNVANRKPITINDKYKKFSGPAIDGYAYDGCGVTITETVTNNTKCGKGVIQRRFTATDPGGLSSYCDQYITIVDSTSDNVKVEWPLDYYSSTVCLDKPHLTPDITGKPKITGADKCANIIQTYDDLVFTLDPDACLKILRKWIVIDWCVYDPNLKNSPGYWSWTQVIKVINTVAPTFQSNCNNRTVDVYGPGCAGYINLVGSAIDDCTDSTLLAWTYQIDLNNDGSVDINQSGKDASGTYPIGTHKVTFRVRDACNNEAVCSFLLTVRDGKKPTPYCLGHIVTTVMPSTQSITIWAKDFNLNSEDNCTKKENLKYYFLLNGRFDSSMVFNCSNIGKNILRIYVVDEAGNSDYCEATLEVQDPNHACPTGLTIHGTIQTITNKPVKDAYVSWERSNPAGSNSTYTNDNGEFNFTSLTSGMSYTIKSEKNFGFINGVSTYDIVLIQKHILGTQIFDSPLKYLAADVNASCTITAADISEIRRLILGKINAFALTPSWKFVPQNSILPINTPCGFEHILEFNLINRDHMNADFYGVKMGDINIDVDAGNVMNASIRSDKKIQFIVEDLMLTSENVQRIPVYASEVIGFEGMQAAFNVDEDYLRIENLEAGQLNVNAENYAIKDNQCMVSLSGQSNVAIDPLQPLFYIIVKAKQNARFMDHIRLNEDLLKAEWYDSDLNIYGLQFNAKNPNVKPTETTTVLYQNMPNPFNESTKIGFELASKQEVEFIFYETNGKVIYRKTGTYNKGYHEFEIKKSELNTFGVFFMQMNTNDFTDTKRLILIR